VPYLWQKKGQKALGLVSQAHNRRLSVLGFFRSRDSCLWSYPTTERLTAQHVIQSVEALLSLLPQLSRPVVLVLDNASIHRAKVVREKQAEWKRQGLRLLFLPPYCPHLNCIEILWRTIKYRWLAPHDYRDFPTLSQSVTDILKNVGTKYRLSFA
jgi:transposase